MVLAEPAALPPDPASAVAGPATAVQALISGRTRSETTPPRLALPGSDGSAPAVEGPELLASGAKAREDGGPARTEAAKPPALETGAAESDGAEPTTSTAAGDTPQSTRSETAAPNGEVRPAAARQAEAIARAEPHVQVPVPDAEANAQAAQILRQVRLRLSPELRQASIQLEPAHLGRLAIRLELRRGRMRAEVVAEEHSTFAALERHVPELRTALAAAGFEGVEVELRHAGQDTAGAPFGLRDARSSKLHAAHATPQPLIAVTRALAARLHAAGGIDTYA